MLVWYTFRIKFQNKTQMQQILQMQQQLSARYEGHPESKDNLAIKKNKQNKNLKKT
jgi:hypothetical protein